MIRLPWRRPATELDVWRGWMRRYRRTRLRGQARDAINPWLMPPDVVGDEAANERYKRFLADYDWHTGKRRRDT